MIKFLHLSDLHFHRDPNDNAAAERMFRFVREKHQDHHLLVTGDITDDGHPEQYDNAFNALAPWKGRAFIAPGNHDYGAAGNFYGRERARRFDRLCDDLKQGGHFAADNEPLVNIVKSGDTQVMLIALDTNLETDHPFDFACGQVGEKQLRALDVLLNGNAARSYVKILFFHHHPFVHNDPFMEIKDARELWRTVYGRVDVMAFGHKHVSDMKVGYGGMRYVLAADNAPGKAMAREITVKGGDVSVVEVSIEPR